MSWTGRITPYGIECEHTIDVTEYASLLQGNPEMRVRIGTFQRGWAVTLGLDYEAGQAPYRYSRVERLWYGYHAFGDPANRQPADTFLVDILPVVEEARLHLVGTGHGWGENNSLNAAEFYNATHHVLVNGQETFAHPNWMQCGPNPDSCSPQNGTWWFAGRDGAPAPYLRSSSTFSPPTSGRALRNSSIASSPVMWTSATSITRPASMASPAPTAMTVSTPIL